jgi:flavin reductase (DIM6/NTAB) family NADH-FMN oxidoreductase RutF/DNA-binding GntR family transcriptional regulator
MSDVAGALDSATYRHVIGHFASGVTIVTADDEGVPVGVTASAVSSLSLEPPMLLVCLNSRLHTQRVMSRTGAFAVNVLAEDHGPLAERFAAPVPDRFAGLDVRRGRCGAPLLAGALATLECRVAQQVEAGTHQVFLADVTEATSTPGRPLTYFRGGFGAFAPVDDRRAYVRVREAVLSGEITVRDEVRPEQVAERLGLPVRTVEAALGRLLEDQLVLSDEGGFRVAALDGPTSDAVLEGQLLLESGVLVRLAGPVPPAQIARLRALAEAIVPLVDGDEFVDPARYATLNHDFHAAVIALAGNSKLGELYDGLAVPSIIARATAHRAVADPLLVRDHLDLVDALEAGDVAAALRIAERHTRRAQRTQRRALEQAC